VAGKPPEGSLMFISPLTDWIMRRAIGMPFQWTSHLGAIIHWDQRAMAFSNQSSMIGVMTRRVYGAPKGV
jgi:hypothetical protein